MKKRKTKLPGRPKSKGGVLERTTQSWPPKLLKTCRKHARARDVSLSAFIVTVVIAGLGVMGIVVEDQRETGAQ